MVQLTLSVGKKPWKHRLRHSYDVASGVEETTGSRVYFVRKSRTFTERMQGDLLEGWWMVSEKESMTCQEPDFYPSRFCWKHILTFQPLYRRQQKPILWFESFPRFLDVLNKLYHRLNRRPLESPHKNLKQAFKWGTDMFYPLLNYQKITSHLPLDMFFHVRIFYTTHCHNAWS